MSFDNNDDEEDNQNEIDYEKLENARYMKMARSRSRKQSKLFSQRKKVNLPKIKNSKQLFNEIYRNKRLHGPIYILTETSKKHQKPKGYSLNSNFTTLNFDKESPKKSYDYNVFCNEDEKIKDLVTKFRNELKERKIGKLEKRKSEPTQNHISQNFKIGYQNLEIKLYIF